MERAIQFPAKVLSRDAPSEHELGLFSTESVLNLQKLIFAGSPLSEVLANIAQLVESQAEGMSCTIWLPDEDGKELHCAAAPSLPGFMRSRRSHGCWSERRILRHSSLSEGAGVCNRHPDRSHLGALSSTACCHMEFVPFGRARCSRAKAKLSAHFPSIIVNHAGPVPTNSS